MGGKRKKKGATGRGCGKREKGAPPQIMRYGMARQGKTGELRGEKDVHSLDAQTKTDSKEDFKKRDPLTLEKGHRPSEKGGESFRKRTTICVKVKKKLWRSRQLMNTMKNKDNFQGDMRRRKKGDLFQGKGEKIYIMTRKRKPVWGARSLGSHLDVDQEPSRT